MNEKTCKGIALLLFAILLSTAEPELNNTLLYSTGDFPFSFVGLIVGCFGLAMVFDIPKSH